eukprot:scaffold2529_cov363-Prasinococcus_capsulatus_cf.AAC.22
MVVQARPRIHTETLKLVTSFLDPLGSTHVYRVRVRGSSHGSCLDCETHKRQLAMQPSRQALAKSWPPTKPVSDVPIDTRATRGTLIHRIISANISERI